MVNLKIFFEVIIFTGKTGAITASRSFIYQQRIIYPQNILEEYMKNSFLHILTMAACMVSSGCMDGSFKLQGSLLSVQPTVQSITVANAVMSPPFSADWHEYNLVVTEDISFVTMGINTGGNDPGICVNGLFYEPGDFQYDVTWDNERLIDVEVISISGNKCLYRFNVIIREKPQAPGEWHYNSAINLPAEHASISMDSEGRLYVHSGRNLYRYTNNAIDATYGNGGCSQTLAVSSSDGVCITAGTDGCVYVPTGTGGNVQRVTDSGEAVTVFASVDGTSFDMGNIRAVTFNSDGTLMWLVQSESSDSRTRGILRMEKINGAWLPSDGVSGRGSWGDAGILSGKDFNSNMKSLVFTGRWLYLGLGSSSRRVYRISCADGSVTQVVNLGSSGENTGENGSCGFLSADTSGRVYVPVLRDAAGEYSEIRVYKYNGTADACESVISGTLPELNIPGNAGGIWLQGLAAAGEGSLLWFGKTDKSLHCLKLE